MTTIAWDTGLQDLFDTDAFKKNIQDKASKVVRKISSAVYDAMMVGSESLQFELDEKFDKKVKAANKELTTINTALISLISLYPSAYRAVNKCIDNASEGDKKLDEKGHVAVQVSFICDLCALTAKQARQARNQIDSSNINRLVLLESIVQLALLEKNLAQIFEEVQELGERIEIHDALTERPVKAEDHPLFKDLLGSAHA